MYVKNRIDCDYIGMNAILLNYLKLIWYLEYICTYYYFIITWFPVILHNVSNMSPLERLC